MFRFEHSEFLYALVALPIVAVLFFIFMQWRKRAIRRFGSATLMARLMPEAARWKHTLKFTLLLLALAFLIVGWANPQWGTKREKAKRMSTDVFIALDISSSMLAEDTPPNRLERAKRLAEDLVEKLKGERIGVILFAGSAYLQMPLTTDYAATELFLRSANTGLAGTQGTAIGEAVSLARRSFQENDKSHKALVLITDGEDHDGEAVEQVQSAKEEGVILFTIGAGTPEGSFIPFNYGTRQDYKRDESGQPVRSRLNEEMLIALSEKGGGAYFHIAEGGKAVQALKERISSLEKREMEVRGFTGYESYFQYFLAAGLLLLVAEFLISYRKDKWLEGRDLFG
jgi:Ca-activated chloride channel homolog